MHRTWVVSIVSRYLVTAAYGVGIASSMLLNFSLINLLFKDFSNCALPGVLWDVNECPQRKSVKERNISKLNQEILDHIPH